MSWKTEFSFKPKKNYTVVRDRTTFLRILFCICSWAITVFPQFLCFMFHCVFVTLRPDHLYMNCTVSTASQVKHQQTHTYPHKHTVSDGLGWKMCLLQIFTEDQSDYTAIFSTTARTQHTHNACQSPHAWLFSVHQPKAVVLTDHISDAAFTMLFFVIVFINNSYILKNKVIQEDNRILNSIQFQSSFFTFTHLAEKKQ